MPATIYSHPPEVGDPPKIEDFYGEGRFDCNGMIAAEQVWVENVRAWARRHGSGDLAGEIFRYPAADGYAQYVVLKSRPLQLVHLPIGDAWDVSDVVCRGLTASDVRRYVERIRNPIFGVREV